MTRSVRAGGATVFLVTLILAVRILEARGSGMTGWNGDPATGGLTCNKCHSGGVTPAVTISGPTQVDPGSTHTYLLTISGGQQTGGGLDVSASDGSLAVVDPGTWLEAGEITHNAPRAADGGGQVVFSFNWTAPLVPSSPTLYGAGNSVNLNSNHLGDKAGIDALTITVGTGASTPGEPSGPDYARLRVSDIDGVTGDMTLTYGAACSTTDNNVYYGPLSQVATLGWSGESCFIGTSGTHSGFNPGSGSFFFVIVGTDDLDEGSYGRARLSNGSEPERAPFTGNFCGQTQTLANSCDL